MWPQKIAVGLHDELSSCAWCREPFGDRQPLVAVAVLEGYSPDFYWEPSVTLPIGGRLVPGKPIPPYTDAAGRRPRGVPVQ